MKAGNAPAIDEIKRLNGCINNLTTILALPAIWIGSDSSQIVSTLLEALVGILRLDFAFARFGKKNHDEPSREMLRLASSQQQSAILQTKEVSRALDRWITRDAPFSSFVVPNPIGEGSTTVALLRLGLHDDTGILVAGSAHQSFPTNIDMLLLRVAANEAAIGLQESRVLGEQKQAAADLERRIGERTNELTKANESFQNEVSRRRQAQAESQSLKNELAEELAAMKRLHEFTARLLKITDLHSVLQAVLNECMELQKADLGHVQLVNRETRALEIVAQRGFRGDFPAEYESVGGADSACGQALLRGKHVIVEDLLADESFAPDRQFAASAGFRAIQCTPLFNRNGDSLGMLSTHFRSPHHPLDRELKFTDLYARLAAELIERCWAEEALRASEERFRRYFELGLVGMAMTSPTKGILEVNDELCRILGYSRDELLKLSWADMTHPDDLAADVAEFNRVLAGDIDGYTLDKRWVRKDGRVISTIMSARCVRRTDGTVDYFVGLVQDITERKLDEEEKRKLAALVENSPEFIGIASLEGRPYVVNAAGRELVGLDSPSQVLETRVLDYIVEEDKEAFQQALANVLREGQWEGETRFRHFKTGAEIPVRQRIFLIREPGANRPVAMATIASDVTGRRRSDEALRAAQAELAHMARVTTMGEMTASIAHEVNQPLTAVVTSGDAGLRWLNQTPPNVAEARMAMKEMVRQGHRASDVITRIRSLIKKSPPRISIVRINQVIEEVLVLTRQQAAEHGVTLRTELAANIDSISGDSVQLQQVLVNLILNAIEATSARGDGARDVVLTSKREGTGEVVVAVRDSGVGIDPRHADDLFHPFFTTKSTGLGMGLAISRSIIEAHGGRLWATANEQQGATFQFSLPAESAG